MSPAATPYVSSGRRTHQGLFQKPGPPVPDGTGWVESWIDLPPAEFARITPASQASLEQITAGTVLSMATHIVTVPYRTGLTTKTRFLYDGRSLSVLGIFDYEERHVQLNLVCAEVVE
jgi:SPP1 family predicted phage head-tail adaptor